MEMTRLKKLNEDRTLTLWKPSPGLTLRQRSAVTVKAQGNVDEKTGKEMRETEKKDVYSDMPE